MAYITPFPLPPPLSTDPGTFDPRADSAWSHLSGTIIPEINALALLLSAAAAPPIAIPYTFSSTTTVADPGAGTIRLNNATQTSATALLADLVDGIGTTVTGLLDQFDDSTSTVKGYLRLTKAGDETKWLVFAVTAMASPSGYRNITVSGGVGSSTSPFADGDNVTLTFVRNGDKGDTGPAALWTDVLSGASLAGLSQVTLSSLPSGYADLNLKLYSTTGSTPDLQMAFSTDGATFSTPRSLHLIGASSFTSIVIHDYRGDRPVVTATHSSSAPGSSPDAQGNGAAGMSVHAAGGLSAIRLSPSAGSWGSGSTLYQPRAR